MLCPLVAIMLMAGAQAPADWTRAQDLARSGRNVEAIQLFNQILESNPADVDARIGLAIVLTRTGEWRKALAILKETELVAGQNADLFAALARAYRRAGDERESLEYYKRAMAAAPAAADVRMGYEGVARTYGHWIALDGFGQSGASGDVGSGAVTLDLRVAPRLHLDATARKQNGPGYSDVVGGGGVVWRPTNSTTSALRVVGATRTTALPKLDIAADIVHYTGVAELGAAVRHLNFPDSELIAVSPTLAWNPDRWRVDARYTYSRSAFDATGESVGDHSVLLRGTWQQWRRIALQAAYAYGIESFETLTADRLGALGTTTLAPGVRIDLKSLTRLNAVWEHQWRSDHTTADRFTLSVIQVIP